MENASVECLVASKLIQTYIDIKYTCIYAKI